MGIKEKLVNLPDAAERIIAHVRAQRPGKYALSLVRANAKKQRTLNQNAYWWGACYPAIAEGIREQWGETYSTDDVHGFCKQQFLSRPVVDRNTGESKGFIVGSTRELSIESGIAYTNSLLKLAAQLGVYVESSDDYHGGAPTVQRAAPKEARHAA